MTDDVKILRSSGSKPTRAPALFPRKATLRRSLGLELEATLEAMTKGGGGEERRQGSGLVPSAKICQDLRPVLQTHPPSRPRPFFSLRVRIEHRLPRPCLQTLYLATAGALEVMSTNRCCREICFYCSTVPSMSQYF